MDQAQLCTFKVGFFILRDCGKRASVLCQTCSRPVCREHGWIYPSQKGIQKAVKLSTIEPRPLDPATTVLLCTDCYVREKTGGPSKDESNQNTLSSSTDPYLYRHHYYTKDNYQPIYAGNYYNEYYDSYDVRAFDQTESEPMETDDGFEPDFSDS